MAADIANVARTEKEERLIARYSGRHTQLRTLFSLFNDAAQAVPALVHIHDAHNHHVESRRMVEDVIRGAPATRYIVIDPLTCPSPDHLFARMHSAVVSTRASGETSDLPHATACSSLDELVHVLRQRFNSAMQAAKTEPDERIVFLFDRAERIRDLWPETVVNGLFGLADLSSMQGRLSIITVSKLDISHFRISRGPGAHRVPGNSIVIANARLSKAEILSGLMLHFESLHADQYTSKATPQKDALRALYSTYTSVAYEAFAAEVRHADELRTLICCAWLPFVRPVLDGRESASNIQSLLLAAASLFRDALDRLHTRQMSPARWTQEWIERVKIRDGSVAEPQLLTLSKTASSARRNPSATAVQPFSLLATLVILSSVLASYNPSRADLRYFVRDESIIYLNDGPSAKRQRKKGGALRKVRRRRFTHTQDSERRETVLSRQELLGPRAFTLDRLLSIMQAVATELVPSQDIAASLNSVQQTNDSWEARARDVGVLDALNSLLKAGLLVRTSALDRLDVTTTFRANVGRETALQLGRKVGVDMEQWMHD